jgi:hypothetical protein
LLATALLGGCADMMYGKRKLNFEQKAVRSAINLCKQFGHKEDTAAFTRCAEQRYDEYVINYR